MPKDNSIKSVLIIGSGPIVIGQACEFDYSGSQASRSLREEGIEVTLINSNPATIMTDPVVADHIYLEPLEPESIVKILEKHDIDAVLPTMGGQTALNLAIKCEEMGIWEDHNVRMIGVNTDAIEITENREAFRNLMEEIDVPMAPQTTAKSFLEGKEVAQEFGYPLVHPRVLHPWRGGRGCGVRQGGVRRKADPGLALEPHPRGHDRQGVVGWKEFELELLRDSNGNVTIVCSIENFDPMGIHTGDSITVAPAMTLSDSTFQRMRDMAIKMMRSIGDFAGGCNVQFAVSPDEKEEIIAIEINPREPFLGAGVQGDRLPDCENRGQAGHWVPLGRVEKPNHGQHLRHVRAHARLRGGEDSPLELRQVPRCDDVLGLQMKAVGEVMAIGRSFQEALQKACQSLELKRNGLGADGRELRDQDAIMHSLRNASWNRLFHVYDAFKLGIPFRASSKPPRLTLGSCAKSRSSSTLKRTSPSTPSPTCHGSAARGQTQGICGPSNRAHPELFGVRGAHPPPRGRHQACLQTR